MKKTVIDRFGPDEFYELLGITDSLQITIYVPTHRSGRDTRQDRIVLKNSLNALVKKLDQKGLSRDEIKSFLKPATDLIDNVEFWNYQANTLAIFISRNFFRYYRLPMSIEGDCVIDPKFYVTPLLPMVTENDDFFILAISEKHVKLYHADRFTIIPVHVKDLPDGMASALWYKKFERQVQFHTMSGNRGKSGKKDAIFHGQADWKDKHKKYVTEYFREVDKKLHPVLNGHRNPLVLATVKPLVPFYRESNTHRNLFETPIIGNPDTLTVEELHKRAWDVVGPDILIKEERQVIGYRNFIGSKRFVTDFEEIITACDEGLVEALFINARKHLWGSYDVKSRHVYADTGDTPDNFELLNLAAIKTISKKGKTFVLPPNLMPSDSTAAAVLRYNYNPPR